MNIISVDDEALAVDYIEELLARLELNTHFAGFTKVGDAFSYLESHKVDVALLDINLGAYSGLAIAKRCKELCPKVNIIFVTGYSQYALDAFRLHASGYLMKPIRAEALRTELENLRHPLPMKTTSRVRIQTFGNFEVFVDGKPLWFPLTKCSECLAYLVDRRGAMVTVAELASVLWEDKPFDYIVQNNTHKVISSMMKILKKSGMETMIIRQTRKIGIDPEAVDCDYYRALAGDVGQLNLFAGEYMKNYSWAEFTTGDLVRRTIN